MIKIKTNLGRKKNRQIYFSEIKEKYNQNIDRNFQFRGFEKASSRLGALNLY